MGGIGSLFGGVTHFFSMADIPTLVLDKGCDLLGVSKETKATVKTVGGLALANPIMASSGLADMAMQQDAGLQQPAVTEYACPDPAKAREGYAPTRPGARAEVLKLESEELLSWAPEGHPAFCEERDRIREREGARAAAEYTRRALLCDPSLREAFSEEFGLELDLDARCDPAEVVGRGRLSGAAPTSRPPLYDPQRLSGYVGPVTAVDTPRAPNLKAVPGGSVDEPSGHKDPELRAYGQALSTLTANWDLYDAADGSKDGRVGKYGLRKVLDDPSASPELKEAARFLLENERYFTLLSQGADRKPGVSREDAWSEMRRVDRELQEPRTEQRPLEEAVRNKPRPDYARRIQDILADPNLSTEEKIMLILMAAMEELDLEAEAAIADLADANQRMIAAQRDSTQGTEDAKAANREKLAKAQTDIDAIQLRLQKLIERRKQMFDLASNTSKAYDHMANTAIQNLRG